MATPSSVMSTIASGLGAAAAFAPGPWGIGLGFGSALLSIGAGLLNAPADKPHVDRVRDATPQIASALAQAEALKASLRSGAKA
jgi:hypothetical protein